MNKWKILEQGSHYLAAHHSKLRKSTGRNLYLEVVRTLIKGSPIRADCYAGNMQYISHYASPLGGILLAADNCRLTGLWFEGQKYFARLLTHDHEERRCEARIGYSIALTIGCSNSMRCGTSTVAVR